jgi:hypothetical protein
LQRQSKLQQRRNSLCSREETLCAAEKKLFDTTRSPVSILGGENKKQWAVKANLLKDPYRIERIHYVFTS